MSQTSPSRLRDKTDPRRSDGAVWILDKDKDFTDRLQDLLEFHGYSVRTFSNAAELFDLGPPVEPVCLWLDFKLGNGVSGMEVHEKLRRLGWEIPTLFVAADWSVRMIVDAIRAGAEDFIPKPSADGELLDALKGAMSRARLLHRKNLVVAKAIERAATLTTRERQVVALVVSGLLNKEIADQLGLAIVTVKVHRARAMQKLQAGNPADLARIAALVGLVSDRSLESLPGRNPEFGDQALAS